MQFEIQVPVFKCAEDKDIFLSRLNELQGLEKIAGRGRNLYLQFSVTPGEIVVSQLQEICHHWHTTFRPEDE